MSDKNDRNTLKRRRENGEFQIRRVGNEFYEEEFLGSLCPKKKKRKIEVNDKNGKRIDTAGLDVFTKQQKLRRQRYSIENKICSEKKASLYNENLLFYRMMLIAHMKRVENAGTEREEFEGLLKVRHKNGEVENFKLKWTIEEGGKSASFSFCDERSQMFDRSDISISSDKVFSMVIKCGLSEKQYNFIRELLGQKFPRWSVIETLFSEHKFSMINIISVIVGRNGKDDSIGFYLDIPSLLSELFKNKDILLDYLVRSILGENFFAQQEGKMNAYWKNKRKERKEKLDLMEKEYQYLIKEKKK